MLDAKAATVHTPRPLRAACMLQVLYNHGKLPKRAVMAGGGQIEGNVIRLRMLKCEGVKMLARLMQCKALLKPPCKMLNIPYYALST